MKEFYETQINIAGRWTLNLDILAEDAFIAGSEALMYATQKNLGMAGDKWWHVRARRRPQNKPLGDWEQWKMAVGLKPVITHSGPSTIE